MEKCTTCSVDNENAPPEKGNLNRRQFLSRLWWTAAGVLAFESVAGLIASLVPKLKAGAFGSKIKVVTVEEARAMPVGTVAYFPEQRFYLSRVESGFLAMYRRCTHLGCVIPWRSDESSEDDLASDGRFNCPCHGAIFNRYGIVKAGPAPRPLDIFPITIENGELVVDTGKVIERTDFDESQVTRI